MPWAERPVERAQTSMLCRSRERRSGNPFLRGDGEKQCRRRWVQGRGGTAGKGSAGSAKEGKGSQIGDQDGGRDDGEDVTGSAIMAGWSRLNGWTVLYRREQVLTARENSNGLKQTWSLWRQRTRAKRFETVVVVLAPTGRLRKREKNTAGAHC